MPVGGLPARIELVNEALHPPPGLSRRRRPENHPGGAVSSSLDVIRPSLVLSAMVGILVGVREKDSMEVLQVALGDRQIRVVAEENLEQVSIPQNLLFVAFAEAVNGQAAEDCRPLNPRGGSSRLDGGDGSELVDLLGCL